MSNKKLSALSCKKDANDKDFFVNLIHKQFKVFSREKITSLPSTYHEKSSKKHIMIGKNKILTNKLACMEE